MRILACAYACDPAGGSERHVGWTCLRTIARDHQVTVITHGWGREIVEQALPALPERSNLRFHFLGSQHTWHPNRLVARLQDWQRMTRWNEETAALARQLVREKQFDMAHHMTIATWRCPSPLTGLGIPLVWGPVGGGESMPGNFYRILSPAGKAFEAARALANRTGRHSRKLRQSAKEVSVALGNNRETLEMLRSLGIPQDRVRYLSQSFLGPEKFVTREELESKPEPGERLRIFAGGNLEGRKGVAIALHALSLLGRKGISFEFTYGGLGPELAHLQKLAAALDFSSSQVHLGKYFDGKEYRATLERAHVYLLPSLREGAPVTMIEAMATGAVPIIAEAGGAPMVVDDSCGRAVAVTDPDAMARQIAGHLEVLAKEPAQWRALSLAAWQRCRERCMEDTYRKGIETAYAHALAHPAPMRRP